MAEGRSVEDQINLFSEVFSKYKNTVENLRQLPKNVQEGTNDDESPVEELLSEVEDHYNEDTPAPVLEYLFICLIGVEEYNRFETAKRVRNNEEDHLLLSQDTFSLYLYEATKNVVEVWKENADYDVRQRILDIGGRRHNEHYLTWDYFRDLISDVFEDESVWEIQPPLSRHALRELAEQESNDEGDDVDDEDEDTEGEVEEDEDEDEGEDEGEEEVEGEKKEPESNEEDTSQPTKRRRLR
jgi:hypothetical protein